MFCLKALTSSRFFFEIFTMFLVSKPLLGFLILIASSLAVSFSLSITRFPSFFSVILNLSLCLFSFSYSICIWFSPLLSWPRFKHQVKIQINEVQKILLRCLTLSRLLVKTLETKTKFLWNICSTILAFNPQFKNEVV